MPLTKRYKLGEFDFVMDLARSLNLLLPRLPGLPLFFFPCSVGAYRSGLFLSRFVPSFRCLVPFSLFFFSRGNSWKREGRTDQLRVRIPILKFGFCQQAVQRGRKEEVEGTRTGGGSFTVFSFCDASVSRFRKF